MFKVGHTHRHSPLFKHMIISGGKCHTGAHQGKEVRNMVFGNSYLAADGTAQLITLWAHPWG